MPWSWAERPLASPPRNPATHGLVDQAQGQKQPAHEIVHPERAQ
jgi:hypothetical protein